MTRVRNGRPPAFEARARRDEFARLVAESLRDGGLDELHRTVVTHAKSVRLDPWRVVKLLVEPQFNAEVERMVGYREAA